MSVPLIAFFQKQERCWESGGSPELQVQDVHRAACTAQRTVELHRPTA
jgi:hypothetical protein